MYLVHTACSTEETPMCFKQCIHREKEMQVKVKKSGILADQLYMYL